MFPFHPTAYDPHSGAYVHPHGTLHAQQHFPPTVYENSAAAYAHAHRGATPAKAAPQYHLPQYGAPQVQYAAPQAGALVPVPPHLNSLQHVHLQAHQGHAAAQTAVQLQHGGADPENAWVDIRPGNLYKNLTYEHTVPPALNDYEILQDPMRHTIGHGAYARVLKIRAKKDRKLFALKIMDIEHYSCRNMTRQLFREPEVHAEATTLEGWKGERREGGGQGEDAARQKKLETFGHQFVCRLEESLEHCNHVFLRLEFTPSTLHHFSQSFPNRMVPEDKTSAVIAQLLHALAFIHRQRIIHRDLKPENVLFDTASGQVKLSDFGWACRLAEHKGNPLIHDRKSICGTFTYMAPEVLRRRDQNTKMDLWSVGVILVEMLCGNPPFPSPNHELCADPDEQLREMLGFVREGTAMARPPNVSASAWDLVCKLLCMDVDRRASAEEALEHQWFSESLPKCLQSFQTPPQPRVVPMEMGMTAVQMSPQSPSPSFAVGPVKMLREYEELRSLERKSKEELQRKLDEFEEKQLKAQKERERGQHTTLLLNHHASVPVFPAASLGAGPAGSSAEGSEQRVLRALGSPPPSSVHQQPFPPHQQPMHQTDTFPARRGLSDSADAPGGIALPPPASSQQKQKTEEKADTAPPQDGKNTAGESKSRGGSPDPPPCRGEVVNSPHPHPQLTQEDRGGKQQMPSPTEPAPPSSPDMNMNINNQQQRNLYSVPESPPLVLNATRGTLTFPNSAQNPPKAQVHITANANAATTTKASTAKASLPSAPPPVAPGTVGGLLSPSQAGSSLGDSERLWKNPLRALFVGPSATAAERDREREQTHNQHTAERRQPPVEEEGGEEEKTPNRGRSTATPPIPCKPDVIVISPDSQEESRLSTPPSRNRKENETGRQREQTSPSLPPAGSCPSVSQHSGGSGGRRDHSARGGGTGRSGRGREGLKTPSSGSCSGTSSSSSSSAGSSTSSSARASSCDVPYEASGVIPNPTPLESQQRPRETDRSTPRRSLSLRNLQEPALFPGAAAALLGSSIEEGVGILNHQRGRGKHRDPVTSDRQRRPDLSGGTEGVETVTFRHECRVPVQFQDVDTPAGQLVRFFSCRAGLPDGAGVVGEGGVMRDRAAMPFQVPSRITPVSVTRQAAAADAKKLQWTTDKRHPPAGLSSSASALVLRERDEEEEVGERELKKFMLHEKAGGGKVSRSKQENSTVNAHFCSPPRDRKGKGMLLRDEPLVLSGCGVEGVEEDRERESGPCSPVPVIVSHRAAAGVPSSDAGESPHRRLRQRSGVTGTESHSHSQWMDLGATMCSADESAESSIPLAGPLCAEDRWGRGGWSSPGEWGRGPTMGLRGRVDVSGVDETAVGEEGEVRKRRQEGEEESSEEAEEEGREGDSEESEKASGNGDTEEEEEEERSNSEDKETDSESEEGDNNYDQQNPPVNTPSNPLPSSPLSPDQTKITKPSAPQTPPPPAPTWPPKQNTRTSTAALYYPPPTQTDTHAHPSTHQVDTTLPPQQKQVHPHYHYALPPSAVPVSLASRLPTLPEALPLPLVTQAEPAAGPHYTLSTTVQQAQQLRSGFATPVPMRTRGQHELLNPPATSFTSSPRRAGSNSGLGGSGLSGSSSSSNAPLLPPQLSLSPLMNPSAAAAEHQHQQPQPPPNGIDLARTQLGLLAGATGRHTICAAANGQLLHATLRGPAFHQILSQQQQQPSESSKGDTQKQAGTQDRNPNNRMLPVSAQPEQRNVRTQQPYPVHQQQQHPNAHTQGQALTHTHTHVRADSHISRSSVGSDHRPGGGPVWVVAAMHGGGLRGTSAYGAASIGQNMGTGLQPDTATCPATVPTSSPAPSSNALSASQHAHQQQHIQLRQQPQQVQQGGGPAIYRLRTCGANQAQQQQPEQIGPSVPISVTTVKQTTAVSLHPSTPTSSSQQQQQAHATTPATRPAHTYSQHQALQKGGYANVQQPVVQMHPGQQHPLTPPFAHPHTAHMQPQQQQRGAVGVPTHRVAPLTVASSPAPAVTAYAHPAGLPGLSAPHTGGLQVHGGPGMPVPVSAGAAVPVWGLQQQPQQAAGQQGVSGGSRYPGMARPGGTGGPWQGGTPNAGLERPRQ